MFDLEEYVVQSNKIEGLFATKGLYHTVHLALAQQVVANPQFIIDDLRFAHSRLGAALEAGIRPGEYRHEDAYIGKQRLPKPEYLEGLMEDFSTFVRLRQEECQATTTEQVSQLAWEIHHEFLCIHPFDDGNGRIARLLLNAFRQRNGLGWHTVFASAASEYFSHIKHYEEGVFKPKYPDVY